MKFEFKNTVLLVEDVEKSKSFYVERLGQEISEDLGRYISFKGGLCIWDAEFANKLIFNQDFERINPVRKQVELYFECKDVTSVYQQMKEQRSEFIHELKEQPWGQRVFRFYDPDRYIIEVAETMADVVVRLDQQGMSLKEIAEKTTFTQEKVTEILKKG